MEFCTGSQKRDMSDGMGYQIRCFCSGEKQNSIIMCKIKGRNGNMAFASFMKTSQSDDTCIKEYSHSEIILNMGNYLKDWRKNSTVVYA